MKKELTIIAGLALFGALPAAAGTALDAAASLEGGAAAHAVYDGARTQPGVVEFGTTGTARSLQHGLADYQTVRAATNVPVPERRASPGSKDLLVGGGAAAGLIAAMAIGSMFEYSGLSAIFALGVAGTLIGAVVGLAVWSVISRSRRRRRG